jgi:hypothetical protein
MVTSTIQLGKGARSCTGFKEDARLHGEAVVVIVVALSITPILLLVSCTSSRQLLGGAALRPPCASSTADCSYSHAR